MRGARVGTWAIAGVIGIVYGVAGTIGQGATWGVFPIGLIVAIIGVAALITAVRVLTTDRWAAFATSLGAMIATILFSGTGPGGSVVVPAPAEGEVSTGIIWTIALPIIAALIVAWPAVSLVSPAAPAADDADGTDDVAQDSDEAELGDAPVTTDETKPTT